ncbi:MAG: hypothetical protein QOJ98_531 [Acidobacteriota bacterium]|nr:hypothetical protein [Acidobacteriota bacterium]
MKKLIFLFLLAFAPAAFGCTVDAFSTNPATIHSGDPLAELVLSGICPTTDLPLFRNITVQDREIRVEFQFNGGGGLTLTPWSARVPLPMLDAGTYKVTLIGGLGPDLFEERTLIVHERELRLTPAFGGELTEVIIEGYQRPLCTPSPCPLTEVFFGSTKAIEVRTSGRAELIAVVPTGSGVVDVRIVTGTSTLTIEDGFRYGGPFEEELERVLFPVNLRAAGAFGSDWRSDIVIRNDGPVTIETTPLFWFDPASPILPIPLPIPPNGKGTFIQRERDGGEFLHMPRGLEEKLSYAVHVVDRSRSDVDLGTEVPVVRAEDTDSVVKLLQIPVGQLYRAKLRVYDIDVNRSVLVTVHDPAMEAPVLQRTLTLTGIPVCPVALCLPDRPGFAVLDLEGLPELQGGSFPAGVDITITAPTDGARLWGFVTVTNNDTQHVTVYTPQHRRRAQ